MRQGRPVARERDVDEPSISVIVPTFNRAGLIGATLDAILAQDHPAMEVVVVDDGSTDATAMVVAGYDNRVRTIRIRNAGDLAARNAGVHAASGRLVAFCDSDDLWRPGFLAAMTRLWQQAPGLLAAFGNFQAVRDGVWEPRTKFDDAPPGFWHGAQAVEPDGWRFDQPIVARLLAFQPFFPSAMVVDRAAFLAVGGWDEAASRIVGSDFATILRVAEHPVGVLRSSLVGIRRHPGNFSADVQAMNLGDAQILEQALATRSALSAHRDAVLRSIADRRAAAADTAFDRHDFVSVRRIQALLPSGHRPIRRRVKAWISHLPRPVARATADLLGRS